MRTPTDEITSDKSHSRHDAKTRDGQQFGLWTVVARIDGSYVLCRCACGTERRIYRGNLTSGKTQSCGCDKARKIAAARTTHGMYDTPTYSSWSSMLTRCTNPASRKYPSYGGRGITVCERWRLFENFLADMGEKPAKGMSIERIDVNGNYEPGNCKWATSVEQARNTRRTKLTQDVVESLRNGELSRAEVIASTGCSESAVGMAIRGDNWKVSL